MNEYDVSDYSIFDNAIATNGVYEGEINNFSESVSDCKSSLSSDIFMGPIADSCQGIFSAIVSDAAGMTESVGKVSSYFNSTSSAYQTGDSESSKGVTDVSDNNSNSSIVTGDSSVDISIGNGSTVVESTTVSNPGLGVTDDSVPLSASPSVSAYASKPELGFQVTTGNKTYDLSAEEFDELCAVVNAESDRSKDDALAVTSAILNRLDNPACVRDYGTTIHSQISAKNQFSVWSSGSYKSSLNGNYGDDVKQAVTDALSGVRNHNYLSFNANGRTNYSNNMITSSGNRYK